MLGPVGARFILVLLAVAGAAVLWLQREPLLGAAGRLVVEEAPPAPAGLVAVLAHGQVLAAAAAAEAVTAGHAPRVLLFAAEPGPEDRLLERLAVPRPPPHELMALVLRRLGVAGDAIVVEPQRTGGTNAAVAAVARYARAHRVDRVLVVTHRSHTRRTAVLLRRALGPGSTVIPRAPAEDPFDPDRWWRDRDSARELVMEALRWFNSLVLRDFWRQPVEPEPPGSALPGDGAGGEPLQGRAPVDAAVEADLSGAAAPPRRIAERRCYSLGRPASATLARGRSP